LSPDADDAGPTTGAARRLVRRALVAACVLRERSRRGRVALRAARAGSERRPVRGHAGPGVGGVDRGTPETAAPPRRARALGGSAAASRRPRTRRAASGSARPGPFDPVPPDRDARGRGSRASRRRADTRLDVRRRHARSDARGQERQGPARRVAQRAPGDPLPSGRPRPVRRRRGPPRGTDGRPRARRARAGGERRLPRRLVRARGFGAAPLSQPPGRGDALVPRPRNRHRAPQSVRGSDGDVPRSRRVRGRPRPPQRSARASARALRPHVRRRGTARLPDLRSARRAMGLRVLRRRAPRQRQALPLPRGRAALAPPPRRERVELALLLPVPLPERHDGPDARHRRRPGPAACARARRRFRPRARGTRRRPRGLRPRRGREHRPAESVVRAAPSSACGAGRGGRRPCPRAYDPPRRSRRRRR
jgi:hypothetical protein